MSEDASRPSFTSFWKKGKQKLRGKSSAATTPEGAAAAADTSKASADAAEQPKSDKDKAQLRRAQVRRAQIQHRQRKANYIKQLEIDVSELRDLVSLTEKETAALFKENFLIREALETAGLPLAMTTTAAMQQQMRLDAGPVDTPAAEAEESPELFGAIDVDDLTVTLSMDAALGAPCFHISSNSSGASAAASTPPRTVAGVALTWEQEQRAVNFILGLEHCCWDHFFMGDFHLHDPGLCSESERGHTLMASAYCMAPAPESVYAGRAALAAKKPGKAAAAPRPSFQWGASGITLESLHGLAASLNPGDLEITPVQAWFELASRYPVEVLLGGAVLDTLQREFNGVVRCVMYGAVIERLAFESIIARVLGPSEGSLWA
ncbi:alanine racemase [Metarhizium guizhouense ARSEF 977]|uniref:Alanine racemase n=1 Tax=Metarhizium guizhouense (strain ARSEF 977) TaxID=1276136 RepID=A0A0B4HDS5_METGA|nr:alanine racemase [Metarhizium guizhouense ARSEF 977]